MNSDPATTSRGMLAAVHPLRDARIEDADELARLIRRAQQAGGRGWCSTTPNAIARFLLDAGVQLPDTEPAKG